LNTLPSGAALMVAAGRRFEMHPSPFFNYLRFYDFFATFDGFSVGYGKRKLQKRTINFKNMI
jgi:hypothetical protein